MSLVWYTVGCMWQYDLKEYHPLFKACQLYRPNQIVISLHCWPHSHINLDFDRKIKKLVDVWMNLCTVVVRGTIMKRICWHRQEGKKNSINNVVHNWLILKLSPPLTNWSSFIPLLLHMVAVVAYCSISYLCINTNMLTGSNLISIVLLCKPKLLSI